MWPLSPCLVAPVHMSIAGAAACDTRSEREVRACIYLHEFVSTSFACKVTRKAKLPKKSMGLHTQGVHNCLAHDYQELVFQSIPELVGGGLPQRCWCRPLWPNSPRVPLQTWKASCPQFWATCNGSWATFTRNKLRASFHGLWPVQRVLRPTIAG